MHRRMHERFDALFHVNIDRGFLVTILFLGKLDEDPFPRDNEFTMRWFISQLNCISHDYLDRIRSKHLGLIGDIHTGVISILDYRGAGGRGGT